jgi:hypothetical protein
MIMKVTSWWLGNTAAAYHVDDDDTVTLTSFSTFWPLDCLEFLAPSTVTGTGGISSENSRDGFYKSHI